MNLEDELNYFDSRCGILNSFIEDLSKLDNVSVSDEHRFLSEAVMFRLFRNYERCIRSTFLHFCVQDTTLTGKAVSSKLKCESWDTGESILKSGNKFLDWGNVDTIKQLSNLVFENGFPVSDILSPIVSDLKDLQRFRNFIAHDSREAAEGFRKSRQQYVKVGDSLPETVGDLALYRRSIRSDITLRIIHKKVAQLAAIIRSI